jgi:hypothetical protein
MAEAQTRAATAEWRARVAEDKLKEAVESEAEKSDLKTRAIEAIKAGWALSKASYEFDLAYAREGRRTANERTIEAREERDKLRAERDELRAEVERLQQPAWRHINLRVPTNNITQYLLVAGECVVGTVVEGAFGSWSYSTNHGESGGIAGVADTADEAKSLCLAAYCDREAGEASTETCNG